MSVSLASPLSSPVRSPGSARLGRKAVAAGRERPALDNRGVTLPPLAPASLLSRLRPLARRVGLGSLSGCGLGAIDGTLPAIVRRGEVASLVGVKRCRSPWVCPHCAPRLAARRAEVLRPQVASLLRQGYRPWLVTLTLRHNRNSSLDELFGLLGKAWSRLTSGRQWASLKSAGVEYLRGYDLTHGENGWHPHIHAVFLFSSQVADPSAEAQRLLMRWIAAIRSLGGDVLRDGIDAQPCADAEKAARYAAHLSGVYEASAGVKKQCKSLTSRTVFDLAQAAVRGDEVAAGLWSQYAVATKGRRALVCSQGLSLAGEGDASEDAAEIEAQQALEEPAETVAVIYPAALVRVDPYMSELLEAAARSASDCRAALTRILGPPALGVWRPSG
ncbi:protein rep [Synechococcus sp. R6-10]|uniref:protein rep n=1 Tax=Synechococcus sp. R6-10 TaxID=2291956 RepID=UPI0039C28B3C